MIDLSTSIHSLSGHSHGLDLAMELMAKYAIGLGVVILLAAWLRLRDGLRACAAAVAGALVAVGVSGLIGMAWDRPRPFVAGHFTPLITHAADASFPSDHVAALAAIAMALWFASRGLSAAAWIVALAVGFARVWVGVHYVSDILGGAALGAVCGVLAWMVAARITGILDRLDGILVRARLRPRFPPVSG